MKKKLPFFAIGNEELDKKEEAGKTAPCPKCKKEHTIEYGTSKTLLPNGKYTKPKKSKILGFIKCGDTTYLASINGKLL